VTTSCTPFWSAWECTTPLWEALHRVHLSDEACPSKLEEWRRAPDGSQEDIWTEYYDEAMGILAMGLQ
jgi:hypothetical protein